MNADLVLISILLSVNERILYPTFTEPVRTVQLFNSILFDFTSFALRTAYWALIGNALIDWKAKS
jgi:hypothetical protein